MFLSYMLILQSQWKNSLLVISAWCGTTWFSVQFSVHPPYTFSTLRQHIFSFRYRQLKQQYEMKVEEEQILQAKMQQSSFHQQQEELERLRKAIGEY